jgi:hypothetical protein
MNDTSGQTILYAACPRCAVNDVSAIQPAGYGAIEFFRTISIPIQCNRCLTQGLILVEDGSSGLLVRIEWAPKGPFRAIPYEEWPRIMEEQAVTWAFDMERTA